MIPKIIHYCWFGRGQMNRKIKECINSWRIICPNYEIKCWNEDNCDINENIYVREAYRLKKWAFVADYFRAKILYHFGGIYLDTDMLLIKNIDFALSNHAFCSLANPGIVSMGLLGFEPYHELMKIHYESYLNAKFIKDDGTINLTTNVTLFSKILQDRGLGKDDKVYYLDSITIYPTDYFYPTDFEGFRSNFSNNTCAVHMHLASWVTPWKRLKIKIKRRIHSSCFYKIYRKMKKEKTK